jgi:hypothetical protein
VEKQESIANYFCTSSFSKDTGARPLIKKMLNLVVTSTFDIPFRILQFLLEVVKDRLGETVVQIEGHKLGCVAAIEVRQFPSIPADIFADDRKILLWQLGQW